MSLISSFNIARAGLTASQAALTVVSNNIANVDNPNYSKLTINLSDVVTNASASNVIQQANTLSGVQVAKITRSTDSYLASYYREQNTTYSYLNKYDNLASNVENIMNELKDTGLSTALTAFNSAVTALNNDPSSSSARENFISTAQNLCSVFNTTYDSLTSVQQSLVGDYTKVGSIDSSEIASSVNDVNSLLDQISEVNANIVQTSSANITSSSLLDQRDSLLEKLSAIIPATIEENKNGTVKISLANRELIAGSSVTGYLQAASGTPPTTDEAVINVVGPDKTTITASNINTSIDSGSMGAILAIAGSDPAKFTINGTISSLNTLASSFASIMNQIQCGDPNGDGSQAMRLSTNAATGVKTLVDSGPTNYLFVNSDPTAATPITGITAGNISVSSALIANKDLVAAGRLTAAQHAAGNYANNIGNNSNSTLMVNSATQTYALLGNQTITGYLSTTVSDIGTKVKGLDTSLKTQKSIVDEVKSRLTSVEGVDIEEELTDMIKYQKAYQASARVFSTCNDLMDTLLNLGR